MCLKNGSLGPAEMVQNRRKTSMIRPKAVKFFSGFRRDVWHRGWGKCVSKMDPLGRPGHAVSLFWGVVVKVAEVFHVYTASRSLPQPALSYQNTMTMTIIFFNAFRRDVWHRRGMKCGSKIGSCAGQAMLGEMCLKNGSVGPARPCSFPLWKLEKLQNRLFFRGSGCNEGGHSVGRLFGGWIVCEIVQNRRKTSMIRPKAGKFFSGFRRDVWHRGWRKCVSKMGPLDRPGHAVSLFWRVLVNVPEVFYIYTFSAFFTC